MYLKDYFEELKLTINSAKFLSSHSLTFEERYPHLAICRGHLTFIDGSELYFMEFLDAEKGIEKVTYRYHYIKEGKLFFRYDNAKDPRARKLSTFPHHKHIPDVLQSASPPTLKEVLDEIASMIKIMEWPS